MMRDSDGSVDMVVLRDGQKVELTGVPFSTEQMEDGTVTTTPVSYTHLGSPGTSADRHRDAAGGGTLCASAYL